MLKKSQIFSFVLSFAVTLIVGFFVWNIFINSDNPKIFTASLPSDSEVININPTADSDQNNTASQDLAPDDNSADSAYAGATITEQEMQDLLDDIQEKLDIISQQVQELIAEQNHPVIRPDAPSDDGTKLDDNQNNDQNINDKTENTSETAVCTGQININTASAEDLDKIIYVGPATAQKIIAGRPFYSLNDLLKVSGIGQTTLQKIIEQGCAYIEPLLSGGGGGGSTPVVYPKILISEIQILPITQRFVELYNPNNRDIDLTGWYLQRKTSSEYTSFVTKNDFLGKTINKNDYFLISRSDITANITLADLTLTPNNFLALKNPDKEISDEMGFGAVDDNKSFGRIWYEASQSYPDTDNDSADFKIDTPTPKAQNITYIEPSAPMPSDDATVTSAVYAVSPLSSGAGIIASVPFGTLKTTFESALAPATGATLDFSKISDPVITGDTLSVTAQDGTTMAIYTITVDTTVILPRITSYTFNGIAQNITVNPTTNPVQIEITANENVNWMYVRVVNISDSIIYKTFGSGLGCVDGTSTCSKTWDGGISHGTALIDGDYQIKVHIKDAANNEFNDYIAPYTITVDTATP